MRARSREAWIAHGIRQLGSADTAEKVAEIRDQLRAMLAQHGQGFDDLAETIERTGVDDKDVLLEPDCPFDLQTLTSMYHRYGQARQFLPFAIWYNGCVTRLRRGEAPTLHDRRQRADVQARLRNAAP